VRRLAALDEERETPLGDLLHRALLAADADDLVRVVELLAPVPEEVDQELARRVGVERLEDRGERVDVVEEGDVVAVVGEVVERGRVGEREALQVAAWRARRG